MVAWILSLHAFVGAVENGRWFLLDERCRVSSLSIKFLENCQSLSDGCLRLLSILYCLRVLRLLLLAKLRVLRHFSLQICYCCRQVTDVLGKLCNGGLKLIDLGMQGFDR